jgi:hypothetical protein
LPLLNYIMHHISNRLALLLKRLLLAFFFLSISRLVFYVYNFDSFSSFTFVEVCKTFLTGLRFDVYYLAYGLFPFILVHVLPFNGIYHPRISHISAIYFHIVLGIALFLNITDTLFFEFSGKRTGSEILFFIMDPANQLFTYVYSYFHYILFVLFLLFLQVYMYPRGHIHLFTTTIRLHTSVGSILLFLVSIPIMIIGMRGGLGHKPLKSIDASLWASPGLESVATSTPFQIIQSLDHRPELPPFTPVISIPKKEVSSSIHGQHLREFFISTDTPFNVVVLVLESFGRDYVGFLNKDNPNTRPPFPGSYTPFLDSLAAHSLIYPFAYANATRSVEAIPAIFAGIPHMLNRPFIYSQFQANPIKGIHHYLHQKGYHTSFFHGAANGTMGIQSFLKKTGPIPYFGLNEYPNQKKHYDGHWGIFDHYYLPYVAQQLALFPTPLFSGIFSLSSHHPYAIPADFPSVKGQLPIHHSIHYTDHAIRLFFLEASKHPYFKRTIFLIVADHASHSKEDYFYTPQGKMEILCMIFDPSGTISPGIDFKTVQQVDILPTLLTLGGINKHQNTLLGESFFDNSAEGKALFRFDNQYYMIQNDRLFHYHAGRAKHHHQTSINTFYRPFCPFSSSRDSMMSSVLYRGERLKQGVSSYWILMKNPVWNENLKVP